MERGVKTIICKERGRFVGVKKGSLQCKETPFSHEREALLDRKKYFGGTHPLPWRGLGRLFSPIEQPIKRRTPRALLYRTLGVATLLKYSFNNKNYYYLTLIVPNLTTE